MIDEREVFERSFRRFEPEGGSFERLVRRRNRRRRNQRIAAGVVGIAVFVAAIWIVTSGLSLDRTEKSVAPAGEVTGPAETGPAETGPPSAPASAAPDVVRQRMCSDGAGSRLELTDMGDRIKVRFEVYRSPVGHEWLIKFRHIRTGCCSANHVGPVFFRATRVASDSGVFVVQMRHTRAGAWVFDVHAKALDTQTGQVCHAEARYDLV